MNRRVAVIFGLASILLSACGPKRPFADIKLQTLASSEKTALEPCATPKCLTVYVAPWCPYCRGSTPMVIALREYLKQHGIATRVVVGQDKPEAVRDYAKLFGPDTFLDPNGWVKFSGGVPAFMVSDSAGILKQSKSGVPQNLQPPWDDANLAGIAKLYGLE